MAYKKRESSKTELAAEIKLTALKNFDDSNGSVIHYGSSGKNLSSVEYAEKLSKCDELRNGLNTILEDADEKRDLLNKEVKELSKISSQFLAAVKARFGEDSTEYDQMGGTKKSERMRRSAKKKQSL
jgi:hypothetical protein